MPVRDLSLVLSAQPNPPLEPAEMTGLRVLSFKTALPLTLACGKRVWDLQALAVNSACLQFGPNDCMVRLTSRLGYTPKVLSLPFRARLIKLQAFHSPDPASDEESQRCALWPVHALHTYATYIAAGPPTK